MAGGMGDETRRFSPGDRWLPIASQLNGWQDAADYVRGLERGGGAVPGSASIIQGSIVPIKNNSGGDRNRFDVLGIAGPIFGPGDNLDVFKTRPGLVGVSPTLADHLGKFAVLLRPVAQGAMGPALVSGVVPCQVYVASGSDSPTCADIDDGQMDHLVGRPDGSASVLWRDGGIGLQWAIVRVGNKMSNAPVPFELYDDLPAAGALAWALDRGTLARDESADRVTVTTGVMGDIWALGSNTKTGGTPSTGARGWYMPWGTNNLILNCEAIAETIIVANTAEGHSPVSKFTSTFTAEFTRVCGRGQNPLHGTDTSLLVYNPGFAIDDGLANILCVLDTGTGIGGCLYRVADADCPAS